MGQIITYGERGILNAIVNYLMASGDNNESIERSRNFFANIRWAHGGKHEWLNSLQNVDVIVEVGLHQFGDPDLIFICTDRDRTHRYIILEAKIAPYETRAKSNSDGMVYGYNSSINGQLALKYRFVQALSQWTDKEHRIEEPAELFEAYQKTLNDQNKGPRRLKKSSILDRILKPVGLTKVNPENCFFIALTIDKAPGPFETVKQQFLPCILNYEGKSIWETVKQRFGWLGYELFPEGLKNDTAYQTAFNNTVKKRIDKKENTCSENYPVFHTENLRNLPELQPAMAKLAALCQAIFPPRDFVIHNGSYSIKHNNITVIKLATNRKDREHIYLGISAQIPELYKLYKSLPISNKFNSPFSLNTRGESYFFDGIAILPDNLDDLLPELEELFKAIYEYLQEDEY